MQTEPKPIEEITEDDFREYEIVRQSGAYNMLDPRARELSGLDRATYVGIIQHYTELNAKWPDQEDGLLTPEEIDACKHTTNDQDAAYYVAVDDTNDVRIARAQLAKDEARYANLAGVTDDVLLGKIAEVLQPEYGSEACVFPARVIFDLIAPVYAAREAEAETNHYFQRQQAVEEARKEERERIITIIKRCETDSLADWVQAVDFSLEDWLELKGEGKK